MAVPPRRPGRPQRERGGGPLPGDRPTLNYDPRGIEIDLRPASDPAEQTGTGSFFCYGTGLTSPKGTADGGRSRKLYRTEEPADAPGDWNTCQVTCRSDAIDVEMNGRLVNRGWGADPAAGRITFRNQATAVEFRKVEVRPLGASSPPLPAGTWQNLTPGPSLGGWADAKTGGPAGWSVVAGEYVEAVPGSGNIRTAQEFAGDHAIRLEFWLPSTPGKRGQAKANSGVFVQERYEVQILDSFGVSPLTPGDCGAVYEVRAPSENACRPPGEWQTLEITFRTAPGGGKLWVDLNGKRVQDGTPVTDPAPGRPRTLALQDHGHRVRFRNVRVEALAGAAVSTDAPRWGILERLAGTRWVNSNDVSFEWRAGGGFRHNGSERPCRDVGPNAVEIDFGGGKTAKLVFDADLTRFDQYDGATGGVLFTGKRASDAKPAPIVKELAPGESAVLGGHQGYVWQVAFSADGARLLTLSQKGPVILWDTKNRTRVWTADVPGDLRAVGFTDGGQRVAVQRAGGLVMLDANTGATQDESRFPANGWGKFSPDGRHLALHTVNDSICRLHAVPGGRVEYAHPDKYVTRERTYAFTADGSACYAGLNQIYRLNVSSAPKPVPTRIDIRGMGQAIEPMDVSPDGRRLVLGSGRVWVDKLKKDIQGDNCVRVWDIPSGRVVATLRGHEGWVWSVCYHPDGRRVLSGGTGRLAPKEDWYGHEPGADNSFRLWDVATQRQLQKFDGHAGAVIEIKCSPDGRYAATGSADGTVRLWRLPD